MAHTYLAITPNDGKINRTITLFKISKNKAEYIDSIDYLYSTSSNFVLIDYLIEKGLEKPFKKYKKGFYEAYAYNPYKIQWNSHWINAK